MTKYHSHRPMIVQQPPCPPRVRVRHSHCPGSIPTRPHMPIPRPSLPTPLPRPGPIYFHHIRKTGGTSLIMSFLAREGDPQHLYGQLCRSPSTFNGKLIRGWDRFPSPDTYFGWSHEPVWRVEIQEGAFTITIFRDPVMRLKSHYRQVLLYDGLGRVGMPISVEEWDWLGRDLEEFAGRVPRKHQQRQLYMFSPNFDVEQASERAESLSCCLHLSDFSRGVVKLGQLLKMNLKTYHIPTIAGHSALKQTVGARIQSESTPEVEEALRDLLRPEYELLEELSKVWKWKNWRKSI